MTGGYGLLSQTAQANASHTVAHDPSAIGHWLESLSSLLGSLTWAPARATLGPRRSHRKSVDPMIFAEPHNIDWIVIYLTLPTKRESRRASLSPGRQLLFCGCHKPLTDLRCHCLVQSTISSGKLPDPLLRICCSFPRPICDTVSRRNLDQSKPLPQ